MAPWRGRLGAPTGRTGPASGRHSGPQGRGGEDPNRRDGSRLGTYPPTDEMAYSRRRNGRDGLEPPPGAPGRPPGGTRGSAKPGRMTRRQASVSAAHFLPGGVCGGPDHAGSCRWDSTPRPPGSRAVPCRPPSRTQAHATNGVCHSHVRIPPNAEIPARTAPPRNGESFPPPAFGGLCRPEAGVPSRPRRRAAASWALPATVSMRNAG